MKTVFFPFMLFCVIFSSCSNSDMDELFAESLSESEISTTEISDDKEILKTDSSRINQVAILYKYIIAKEDRYELSIGKDVAISYGVTPDVYDEVHTDLEIGNKSIQEFKAMCDTFELLPVENEVSSENDCILALNMGCPRGSIVTSDAGWGYAGTEVPIHMKTVRFSYMPSVAPTPMFHCGINCFGKIQGKSGLACLGIISKIELPVAASGSGIWAKFCFRTTDSKGGVCRWTGI